MQSQLNELFSKEMDRRDFLKHVGVGLVALTGVSALVKVMTPASQNDQGSVSRASLGYGGSVYGGNKPQ